VGYSDDDEKIKISMRYAFDVDKKHFDLFLTLVK
jgi:hypothetical protein